MRSRIRSLVVVLVGAATLLSSGVLGQTPADDAAALASRFPTEFAGHPVDVTTMDGQAWIDAWLASATNDEAAALNELLTADRTPADLVVADAFIETRQDFAEIMAFQLPGAGTTELAEALVPVLTKGFEDRQRTELELAGQPIRVVSNGPPDMEFGYLLALFPVDDVVWAVLGTGSDLIEVVEAIITAASAPQVPIPSSEPVPEGPTASEVIMADVAAGTLDEATGLLYRVYAISGDPLLPEQYAAYPSRDDDTAFDDAAFLFDSLPAAVQDAIAPYVVRPTDPRSIYDADTPAAGGPAIAALLAAQPPCADGDWVRQASDSIPVVVWSKCRQGSGDPSMGKTLATLEGLYPDMVALMGKPIPDAGGAANGGNPSIDVYLVSKLDRCPEGAARTPCIPSDVVAVARAAPPYGDGPAGTSSGYLVLDRTRSAAAGPRFVADVAHELFHLFQAAYNVRGLVLSQNTSHWFREASAVWAEHAFVPEARASQVYPRLSAFQGYHAGLASPIGTREYNAYLWPYFMEQESGQAAIAEAWGAIRGKVGKAAVDEAIASVVPFDTRYREFAVRAWNAPLPADAGGDAVKPRFQALDGAMPQLKPREGRWVKENLAAQPREAAPIEVPQWLDSLDHFYREYVPDDDVEQLVVDFSGVVAGGDLDVEALLHRTDGGWERRPLPDGETTFCLDPTGDDLDRLILVLANHSHLDEVDGTFTLRPLSDPCALWEGTMSENLRWDKGGSSGEWTATFSGRWEPAPPGIAYCYGAENCVSYIPIGTVVWRSDSAYRGNDCARSGSGSLATGDVITPQGQMLYLAPDDADHLRYWGDGILFLEHEGCLTHDGTGHAGPSGFFYIQQAETDAPKSDEGVGSRPICGKVTWRIERGADRMAGTCWLHDLQGYEHRVDWDLRRVGAEVEPG